MSFPKLYLLVLLSVLSLPAILSLDNSNTSIETLMNEAESHGLSVVYNKKGRSLPLFFSPIYQLVSSISPTTAVKLGLIYSATLYMLTYLFPAAFGIEGRNARMASFDFDYDYITSSANALADRTAVFLNVPEPECRYRAICETATYIATKVPVINEWAKKVSGAFFLNLANPYSKAWINGMMQIDCATTYSSCYESPYKTLLNRFVAKK